MQRAAPDEAPTDAPDEAPTDAPETLGTQAAAVEASSDAPVAVAQEIKDANGHLSVWTLTCDSSHRLLRQKYQGSWSPKEYFDSACGGTPALAYFDPSGMFFMTAGFMGPLTLLDGSHLAVIDDMGMAMTAKVSL